ncbi:ABC transporter permease [Agromyces aerolatus]|uniref:ABC transporter permease n=1 Tax=Agromyces sp. LY-1074 TaxID=3074080 RepID=UPI00285DFFB2|nr:MULTISPECIES: ABC transporter permease [unclassified Agromyces]MDR5699035.1 ABC transporter permease [Agromyces sp. LY-1074]MDR5705187.1 ABC transporter permease [Agromyces sp. LY-1358]
MIRYLAQRLVLSAVVLLGLLVMAFAMVQILPGDPARAAAGRNATAEQVDAARQQLGLDQPLIVQFFSFLGRVFTGDLGNSVFTQRPVLEDIAQVLPSSIELVVAAMVINVSIAVPLGVLAAYRRGRAADIAARLLALLGAALPVFWLALLLQLVFSVTLGWLPLYGQLDFGMQVPVVTGATTIDALLTGDPVAFGSALVHLILPAVTLSASFIAVIARTVRSSMITALDADYVTLARSTGAGELRVVVRHGLRNALIPMSTILGMQLGWMLGACVLVESTFNRKGIGAYMVNAVLQNDLYAVIGSIVVIGVVFVVTNLIVDVVQLGINPRLRDGTFTRKAPGAAVLAARIPQPEMNRGVQ